MTGANPMDTIHDRFLNHSASPHSYNHSDQPLVLRSGCKVFGKKILSRHKAKRFLSVRRDGDFFPKTAGKP